MSAWNVIITAHEGGFDATRELFEKLGSVSRTEYLNVLVMQIDNPLELLERIRHQVEQKPRTLSYLARVIPLTRKFHFQTTQEFESRLKEAGLEMARDLSGKSFHVRMHRRGFKGRLSSEKMEQLLDSVIVDALAQTANPARVTFTEPDAIFAIETLGQSAGLSIWSRNELQRYPFLGLD